MNHRHAKRVEKFDVVPRSHYEQRIQRAALMNCIHHRLKALLTIAVLEGLAANILLGQTFQSSRRKPERWNWASRAASFFTAIFITFLPVFATTNAQAITRNGFDLDDASVPSAEIKPGGPPRDGIPALTNPDFVPNDEAEYLDPDDRVMGVVVDNTAKAYPVRILNWHEIVNDRIGNQSFAVTYCPLCGSGVVFASNAGEDGALNFGVSGLLYNSDVLLYDRQTKSLWSQLKGEAISGKLKGTSLPVLPVVHTTWREWQSRHPDSVVLDEDTGFKRIDYDRDPYQGYSRSRRLYFDVSHKAPANYHPKEQILGVEIDGHFKAYPFQELSEYGREKFTDTVGGSEIQIFWNEEEQSAYAEMHDQLIPATVAFWFAWYTFHPDTEVFKATDI